MDYPKVSSVLLSLLFVGLTHILDFGVALVFLGAYLIVAILFDVNRKTFVRTVGIVVLVLCVFFMISLTAFSFFFQTLTR